MAIRYLECMYFFTATILNWQHLLQESKFKQVIVDSLEWMVKHERAYVYGFVIMPNHFHVLWDFREPFTQDQIEDAVLKFTGHQFKNHLRQFDMKLLERYRSTQADREFQFWERRPYAAEMYTREVAEQKLEYMHENPCQERWQLATAPENYFFSSARFYVLNKDDFGFITHYAEHI
jgi:REP element-mobilizing transposase RayT